MIENFRRDPPFHGKNTEAENPPAYHWESEGKTHSMTIDKSNVIHAKPLSDKSGIIVLQSHEKHGHNNVVILNADGSESFRVSNPYPSTEDYKNGDEYFFYGISILITGEVTLDVCAKRKLPGKAYSAEPIYEATYDEHVKSLISIKWKPWV